MSKLNPSTPTRLYLIRHGEVSRVGYCNGQVDIPLTASGKRQMERVARLLRQYPIRAVYASDLTRALWGAKKIAGYRRLKVAIYPGLREKCFGKWEGLSLGKIRLQFPNEWRDWMERPDRARPTGGESYREVEMRVRPIFKKILSLHRGQHVAIVSHGGINRIILSWALALDLRHLFRIEQEYACINVVDYDKDETTVNLMNGQHITVVSKKTVNKKIKDV